MISCVETVIDKYSKIKVVRIHASKFFLRKTIKVRDRSLIFKINLIMENHILI
jgi:hypothetical protein